MLRAFQKKDLVVPAKRVKRFSLLLVTVFFLSACSQEGFYQGMYHGLQQREEVVHPSDEPFPDEQPSYEAYRREREEVLHHEE